MSSKVLNRNFLIRTVSGAAMLLLLLGAVFLSAYTMAALFAAVCVGSMLEFYKIARLTGASPLRVYPTAVGLLAVGGAFCVAAGYLALSWLLLLVPCVFVLFIAELYRRSASPLTNVAWAVTGIVYVAVPFALLVALPCAGLPGGGVDYRPLMVLSVIFMVWANDVGAYLSGITFGKHRLFERISPKKSWEGFFGGVICAVAVGVLMGRSQEADPLLWAGAGLVVAVCGVYGDLVESMLKRSVDLKDSGNAIPGHGGFLDRFDALLVAVPFVFVYLKLFA